MDERTSTEADSYSMTQAILCLLWHLKIGYHVHEEVQKIN
jgi:hypothetical protein